MVSGIAKDGLAEIVYQSGDMTEFLDLRQVSRSFTRNKEPFRPAECSLHVNPIKKIGNKWYRKGGSIGRGEETHLHYRLLSPEFWIVDI